MQKKFLFSLENKFLLTVGVVAVVVVLQVRVGCRGFDSAIGPTLNGVTFVTKLFSFENNF